MAVEVRMVEPTAVSSENELDANVVDRVTGSSTLDTLNTRFSVALLMPSLAVKMRVYEVTVS